jgi:cellulose synthase/poly-beta-1,6-N-acetylglucosamine synthase-like glycosyltransferase
MELVGDVESPILGAEGNREIWLEPKKIPSMKPKTPIDKLWQLAMDKKYGNMLLSVIIPVYSKPQAFLPECIERSLGQSFADFELISVHDASPP